MLDSNLHLVYLFFFEVDAKTTENGIEKARPTIRKCEEFADSLGVSLDCHHIGVIDEKMEVRVRVQIKGDQGSVLIKVSALFAFAASLKLTLGNQFFFDQIISSYLAYSCLCEN